MFKSVDTQGLGLLSEKLNDEIKKRTECCDEVKKSIEGVNERITSIEDIEMPEAIDTTFFHKNYSNLGDTFTEVLAPDGTTLQYANKLNVGDTIVVDGCVYENTQPENQTRPKTDDSYGWRVLCDAGDNGCGNSHDVLAFSSCEELAEYGGTKECPLVDGMLASVRTPDGCFEIYSGLWFEDSANIENDGDACGKQITHHTESSTREFRWTELFECNDVYVDGATFDIISSKLTLTRTNGAGDIVVDIASVNATGATFDEVTRKLRITGNENFVPFDVEVPSIYATNATFDKVTRTLTINGNDNFVPFDVDIPCCPTYVPPPDADGSVAFVTETTAGGEVTYVRTGKLVLYETGTYIVSSQSVVFCSNGGNSLHSHAILKNGIATQADFWSNDHDDGARTNDHCSVGTQIIDVTTVPTTLQIRCYTQSVGTITYSPQASGRTISYIVAAKIGEA